MSQIEKPFSQACEENKRHILDVIGPLFAAARTVLEVGSGTGQHAVFFGEAFPHLLWQTSDVAEYHSGIRLWIEDAGVNNVLPPLELDVTAAWPAATYDAVFSANTAHIMCWPEVEDMLRGVSGVLIGGGPFALYGPFNYGGHHTSESNARFDAWLKTRDPRSGIKDFDELEALARAYGLGLDHDYAMPANNRTLVWRRS